MAIQKIDDIYELLKGNTQKKRLVVAYANDSHSIEAVNKAVEMLKPPYVVMKMRLGKCVPSMVLIFPDSRL